MKLFKSFVLAGLMAVVAYGVYATIIKGPKPQATATAPAPLWENDSPPGPVPLTPGELLSPPDVVVPSPDGAPPEITPAPPSARHEHHHHHHSHESDLPAPPGGTVQPPVPGSPGLGTAESFAPGAGTTPDEGVAKAISPHPAPAVLGSPGSGSTNSADALTPPASVEGSAGSAAAPGTNGTENIQAAFDATLLEVNQQVTQNRLAEAHLQLSRWYGSRAQLDPQRQQLLLDLLDRLAAKVVYSRESYLDRPHVVQPEETLDAIAERYGVPARLLEKINRLTDPASLRPGTELKVVRGPFHAEVQLDRYEMTLYLNDGRYAGRFPIGVGSEVAAKEGEYVVTEKSHDPPYSYLANGQWQNISGGDPNNPLGNRLVELGVQPGQQGELAIHGTNNPKSVGTAAQEGCIRLKPQDADDVYDILSKNTSKVIIRR